MAVTTLKNIKNYFLDFFVIAFQSTFHITIVPYAILGNLQNSKFILFYMAIITFLLTIIRFGKRTKFSFKIVSFLPMKILIVLFVLQLISMSAQINLIHFGAVCIIIFNLLIFYFYLNNIYLEYKFNSRNIVDDFNKYFCCFAIFNVCLVMLAATLLTFGIIAPFTNYIGDLFPALLGGNVETGTAYYMPGWLSVQTPDQRLNVGNLGSLYGWSFEPHTFCYLIIPAMFFILGCAKISYKIKIILSGLFVTAFLFSFSVTALISLILVLCVVAIIDFFKRGRVYFLLLVGILFVFMYLELDIVMDMYQYFLLKTVVATHNVDYSLERLQAILVPKTILGDGVMLLSNSIEEITSRNAGIFSAFFYLMFYGSLILFSIKLIMSNERQRAFYGCGCLYFLLHSFKLTASVFSMPYTLYIIMLMHVLKDSYTPEQVRPTS